MIKNIIIKGAPNEQTIYQGDGPLDIDHAGVAELADALDLGSSGSHPLEVQILSPAPASESSNLTALILFLSCFSSICSQMLPYLSNKCCKDTRI